MDYHYDPVPLPERERLSPEQSLAEAKAYYEDIRSRHSVRDFSEATVDRAVIESCLLAAGTAPSGANHQPWHFVCVSDPETKQKIRVAAEAEERK
ncbi:MAG: nitroreductase family protein, partial [Gammaproteobacteria bacterium]